MRKLLYFQYHLRYLPVRRMYVLINCPYYLIFLIHTAVRNQYTVWTTTVTMTVRHAAAPAAHHRRRIGA